LLVVAAAALDVTAKDATENAVAANVRRSTHAQRTTVSVSSFPFLYQIAADGRVDRIVIDDYGVPAGPLRLDQVQLDARDVRFDRHALVQERYVDITSVSRATVTVVARLSSLQAGLAHDLGLQVEATSSDQIALRALGRTVATIDLTRISIVPRCPVRVVQVGDTYRISCTVAPVPAPVLAALSRASSTHKI
jgi:LmeA-like phospholipid-binding